MEELVKKEEIENRLAEMEQKIDSIDKNLTQVVDAILGNPLTKTGGFVSEQEILKQRMDKIEQKQLQQQIENDLFKNRIIWTVGVIVSVFFIVQYIINIYSTLKK